MKLQMDIYIVQQSFFLEQHIWIHKFFRSSGILVGIYKLHHTSFLVQGIQWYSSSSLDSKYLLRNGSVLQSYVLVVHIEQHKIFRSSEWLVGICIGQHRVYEEQRKKLASWLVSLVREVS